MLTEKRKIPKGMSFPLKVSALEAVFSANGISVDTHLIQGSSSKLLECFFWPPHHNVNHERLYIRTSAVSSVNIYEARAYLEDFAIPQFIEWLKSIVTLPPKSTVRREQQYFERSLP